MAINSVKAVELKSYDAAALTGGVTFDYLSPLDEACFLLRIVNDSDTDVTISYDGVTAHDYIIAGNTLEVNAQANSRLAGDVALFRKGMPVYVLGTAGTGFIYLVGYYT